MSLARSERLALANLLLELGPDAPTLCGDWTTNALAAHLVVRERRPDATPGVAISALAPWTARVQDGYEDKPFEALVRLVRTGPGRLSPFSLPGVDKLLNTSEYAVHHEDVRRAQPGWQPRELPPKVADTLWRAAQARARLALGSVKAGVVLARSDADESKVVNDGEPAVTLTGPPMELLLFLYGRRDHARVEITGDPVARAALDAASLVV